MVSKAVAGHRDYNHRPAIRRAARVGLRPTPPRRGQGRRLPREAVLQFFLLLRGLQQLWNVRATSPQVRAAPRSSDCSMNLFKVSTDLVRVKVAVLQEERPDPDLQARVRVLPLSVAPQCPCQ